ncbi:MAG: hypothetical protein GDA44_14660 [Prochloron sp. SP5CPC1]|nr:hypothetical protein [Candidatus Paraprochloron terpiosi SP5CPC1]
MSYSEFTLSLLKSQFKLTIVEQVELFPSPKEITPSQLLQDTLAENIPLALGIDTEKARSEMIIAPVLIELRKLFDRNISLFSGIDFTIDKEPGLNGICDFILSKSPEQLDLTAPVVIIVEAKNDNIKSGIPQCIAEMLAAQIFNERAQNNIPSIYGIVTTGSLWKFMKLTQQTVTIELKERFIENLELLLGILSYIIDPTLTRSIGFDETAETQRTQR